MRNLYKKNKRAKLATGLVTLTMVLGGVGTALAAAPSALAAETQNPLSAHEAAVQAHVSTVMGKTQTYLDAVGYTCDTTDGTMTKRTRAALLEFQRDHDLEETGIADNDTVKALGEAMQEQKEADAAAAAKKAKKEARANAAAADRAIKRAEKIAKRQAAAAKRSGKIPAKVWLKQTTGDNCTISSCTILLRAKAFLDGKDYEKISIADVSAVGWSSAGCLYTFSFGGETVNHENLSGSGEQRKAAVMEMLQAHPEGMVLYGYGGPDGSCHAFYANLDKDGKIRTLDPANDTLADRYVAFEDSWAASCRDWNYIQAVWYLAAK